MPAQPGQNIVLGYGSQGAKQVGGALALDYSAATATLIRRSASRCVPWGTSELVRMIAVAPHPATSHHDTSVQSGWVQGIDLDATGRAPWGIATGTDSATAAPWGGPMRAMQPASTAPWGIAITQDCTAAAPWQGPLNALQPENQVCWGTSNKADDSAAAPWAGPMLVLQPAHLVPWGKPRPADAMRYIPWTRYSRPLRAGWMIVTPVDPGPKPEALLYILPAKVYMSLHSIWAERVSDGAEIPIYEATLAADSGSCAWTLTATCPASLYTLLAPVDGFPAQIRITVDGIQFGFLVESRHPTKAFGKHSMAISGRSVTALLGGRWRRQSIYTSSVARTARQLAEQAMDLSGVALDWGITDWLVPGDTWQHAGTPLSAVMAIAEAAGGYVQSHRHTPTLLVRHPYPTAPWAWAAGSADVEIAPDALITIGAEENGGTDINAVYVSGTTTGVLAHVLRAGSAGDKLAPMATDSLITHVDAARQRGLAILGAGGVKQHLTVDMPILTGPSEPGILSVGQLVQINDTPPWRARVRAVSVAAKRAAPRQTVTLERHMEVA